MAIPAYGHYNLICIIWSSHVSSCPSPHFLSHGVIPMSVLYVVHELWCVEWWCSFAYYGRLLQVYRYSSIRSEFKSDLHFCLSLTIKKIADRWTFCFHSKGALSNGGGAHWLSRILWQLNEASDVLLGPHYFLFIFVWNIGVMDNPHIITLVRACQHCFL